MERMSTPVESITEERGTYTIKGAGDMAHFESEDFAMCGARWRISIFFNVDLDAGRVWANRALNVSIYQADEDFVRAADNLMHEIERAVAEAVQAFLTGDSGRSFMNRSKLAQAKNRMIGAAAKVGAARRELQTAESELARLEEEYERLREIFHL